MNLYHNGKYIISKNDTLVSRSVYNYTRNHHQFCAIFALKQILQSSTRITCRSTSLIDHNSASIPARISQHGVINASVSDHQLSFRSFKKYTVDSYKDALKKVTFLNYRSIDT